MDRKAKANQLADAIEENLAEKVDNDKTIVIPGALARNTIRFLRDGD